MPRYKLTYFNLNALGEPIRWLFKVAGVPFEDERIERETWGDFKESGRFPGKQVPLLEIDGSVYTQSNTILRYLGNKYGLTGDDEVSKLRVDQVVDIVTDGRLSFRRWAIEQDPEAKELIKKDLAANVCPLILKQVTDIISLTAKDGNFILGSKLTWGDLVLANWVQIWEDMIDPNLLGKYAQLARQKEAVLAVPQIREWLEVRPKVRF